MAPKRLLRKASQTKSITIPNINNLQAVYRTLALGIINLIFDGKKASEAIRNTLFPLVLSEAETQLGITIDFKPNNFEPNAALLLILRKLSKVPNHSNDPTVNKKTIDTALTHADWFAVLNVFEAAIEQLYRRHLVNETAYAVAETHAPLSQIYLALHKLSTALTFGGTLIHSGSPTTFGDQNGPKLLIKYQNSDLALTNTSSNKTFMKLQNKFHALLDEDGNYQPYPTQGRFAEQLAKTPTDSTSHEGSPANVDSGESGSDSDDDAIAAKVQAFLQEHDNHQTVDEAMLAAEIADQGIEVDDATSNPAEQTALRTLYAAGPELESIKLLNSNKQAISTDYCLTEQDLQDVLENLRLVDQVSTPIDVTSLQEDTSLLEAILTAPKMRFIVLCHTNATPHYTLVERVNDSQVKHWDPLKNMSKHTEANFKQFVLPTIKAYAEKQGKKLKKADYQHGKQADNFTCGDQILKYVADHYQKDSFYAEANPADAESIRSATLNTLLPEKNDHLLATALQEVYITNPWLTDQQAFEQAKANLKTSPRQLASTAKQYQAFGKKQKTVLEDFNMFKRYMNNRPSSLPSPHKMRAGLTAEEMHEIAKGSVMQNVQTRAF